MSQMGYGHWVLVALTALIFLLMEWRDGNVARNPFIAAIGLVCVGIVIALWEGDFEKMRFIEFMLFMDVDFASTTVAIGYSLFVFGLLSPMVLRLKKRQKEK